MTDIWNLPSNISSIYIGENEIQSIVQTKDGIVLYQKSQSHTYVLTVQLSSNSIYTDGSTVISGVLTDNGSAMANETITVYDGNTSLGTCTTDSNGAYSKTLSGFSAGTHTLKASHTNVDSSNVTLSVNNHIYAITASANPITITSGESSIISATLTKDSNPYANQTVTFSYGGNSYTSTTDANGVATYTYNGVGAGSVTITVSSNNVSNAVTITDNQSGGSTPSSISISATKDVLSAYHGDTCTLTATVLDNNNNPCSGETVTFKNGSTVLGTDTTDANGKAEYIYVATGVGDVTITVECSLLSEIYELEDCIYDHTMTSADSSHWTIPSSANATYDSNGMRIAGRSWSDCYLEIPISKPVSVEYDVTNYTYTGANPPLTNYTYTTDKSARKIQFNQSSDGYLILDDYPNNKNSVRYNLPKPCHIKIAFKDNIVEVYVDDVLKINKSYSMPSQFLFGVSTAGNRSTTYKNIKVKAL